MGQHHLDVCGDGAAIERRHLLRLAADGGVPLKCADEIIARMLEQASGFSHRVAAFPIRRATARGISSIIDACRRRLEVG